MGKGIAKADRLTREVTIYALTDPDSGEVRYIGETIGDPVKRHYAHVVASRSAQCTPVGLWIRTLQQDGQVPGLTILEAQVAPHRNAEREQWWISHYVWEGARLLNKTTAAVSRWRPPPRAMHGHPLRRWRISRKVTPQALSAACHISVSSVARIEGGGSVPLGKDLEALMDYTGLPAEAFVLPERFMREQPNLLRKYRWRGKGGQS